MENKSEIMNPQVKKVTIGKKFLKEINVYPLSAGDQIKLSHILSNAMKGAFEKAQSSEFEFLNFLMGIVQDNLGKVLSFVTDEGESLAEDITNEQVIEIGTIIYETNFVTLKKKLQMMITKVRELSLEKLSPVFSDTTLNTDLKTSIESPLKTED
jgi:hypothetical protein